MSKSKAEQYLLDASLLRGKEDPVKVKIAHALAEFGYEVESEYETGVGPVDLYLPSKRALLEIKAPGSVNPEARRAPSNQTQYQQLQRYVDGLRARVHGELQLFQGIRNSLNWIGILSDGQKSYVYEWADQLDHAAPLREPTVLHGHYELLGLFESLQQRTDGSRPLVPLDPTSLFIGREEELRNIWREIQHQRHAQTQRQLWAALLQVSGFTHQDEVEAETLFIKHCLLVCIARTVSNSMRPYSEQIPLAELTTDYLDWVTNDNRNGTDWFRSLNETVVAYDWRLRHTDILRTLYENTIPKHLRKVFGEYYTPDWLAQLIVEQTLDDQWCNDAIQTALDSMRTGDSSLLAGRGVLDPTCGSGTFLYHAAQHLLSSPLLQSKSLVASEKTRILCDLIHGFDVHPVAVEFSIVNLLRALPAPVADLATININQGDSLISAHSDVVISGALEVRSPKNNTFYLPLEFLKRTSFQADFRQMVKAANAQENSCPSNLLHNLSNDVALTLADTYSALKQIIREEGNGIWIYHVINLVAPRLLAERKVDRIVANPPWVRVNELQVAARKDSFEALAKALNIWVGGKRATALDIGAVFVLQCSKNYLAEVDSRATWVLNDASRYSGSWKKFREQLMDQTQYRMGARIEYDRGKHGPSWATFGELSGKSAPFAGAACCIWRVGHAVADEVVVLKNASQKVSRDMDWSSVAPLIDYVQARQELPPQKSEYLDHKGYPLVRNGATMFPQSLVRVKSSKIEQDRVIGYTSNSHISHWVQFNGRSFDVPYSWLTPVVFSADLLCYCTKAEISQCIVPRDSSGLRLLNEAEANEEPYWRKADTNYQDCRGIGKSTPQTLLQRIDHQKQLSRQLSTAKNKHCVIYNGSGTFLRASLLPIFSLIEHTCYRFETSSKQEAVYLMTLLNAETLQPYFRASRETDRHFDTHFWKKVPIPRFDGNNPDHRNLVRSGKQCEIAAREVRDSLPAETGQIKLCKHIREELVQNGLSEKVDHLAQDIVCLQ